MRSLILFLLISLAIAQPSQAWAADEITLFSGTGKADAYIALDDEMTIYLWCGRPVAYLEKDNVSGYHAYGFNGMHLGWFVKGILRDHEGNASRAVKEAMRTTEFEPFKAFKQFKPFKTYM